MVTGGERRELTLGVRVCPAGPPDALQYSRMGYANLRIREGTTLARATASQTSDLDCVSVGGGAALKVLPQAPEKSDERSTDDARGIFGNTITTDLGFRI